MRRRYFLKKGLTSLASLKALSVGDILQSPASQAAAIDIENDYVRYVIAANGQNLHFMDKLTGKDYSAQNPNSSFSRVKKAGREYNASSLHFAKGTVTVEYGESGLESVLRVTTKRHYFVWEVVSLSDENVEELVFCDLQLTLQGSLDETFAGCALALNLKTNVPEFPCLNNRLRAICYPRFGLSGSKVAMIGCPTGQLRQVLKEVVMAAEGLPHSSMGGPWAMDAGINKGSYLFNFGDLSEDKVEGWIKLVKDLGLNQIDFHGGTSFRFGDFQFNPVTYPRGSASLKAVIDKLHDAGISAGLHTYAFFIAKSCPWVTPVPDPRLASDATFTLAELLSQAGTNIPVVETTKDISTITGFSVRNSVTLRIDEELVTYSGTATEPPYAFTSCSRGAYGTRSAAHAQNAKVYHLKECFGLFVPDVDSTLFSEVAVRTAETFNECGFDMMYLDALDGDDILGGLENSWHYGSKFVFEIWKRLKKSALMEMSTFHHHLWCVRSRMGAADYPTRGHKRFIDSHCRANEDLLRMFLPGQLGWWAILSWTGPQTEPTFEDDIEYLCGKALGTGSGLSLMGIDPVSVTERPALGRFAPTFHRYEALRHANYFPESIKARLRVPGDEFTLIQNAKGDWLLQPVQYSKYKVEGINNGGNAWKIRNRFHRQPVQIRIEAMMSAAPYGADDGVMVVDFSKTGGLPDYASAPGVRAELQPVPMQGKQWPTSGYFTASNLNARPEGSWVKMGKIFTPSINLGQHQALGVWVNGDGQGEVLNFQLKSPEHISTAIGDHYVIVDFIGWRYFELIEPEAERYSDYVWPYGSGYSVYRQLLDYGQVESLSLWYNNIPGNGKVACSVSAVKALPLVRGRLSNPTLSIGDMTMLFPVVVESGCYLEFRSTANCALHGPGGEMISKVEPVGDAPILEDDENQLRFTCDAPAGVTGRAKVTIITTGEPLR